MIPQTEAIRQADTADTADSSDVSWQHALANVIREPEELFNLLELDKSKLPDALRGCDDFPLQVPRAFVDRMVKGDWSDPLLQQILPLGQELDVHPGFSNDPLLELSDNPIPGLIHKYHGRVLLIVSGGCAINCRYCFRRHFPYQENNPSRREWQQALDYIRQDNSIKEVILSGGDPLAANDNMLRNLTARIADIPHVEILRVHSRMPVVIPQRITSPGMNWLTDTRLTPVMVIHSNHPNEIDHHVIEALQTLKREGVTLLNQTVLLAGINDNPEALLALSKRLFAAGVLPYYLHMLDKVSGAAHFEVTERRAKELITILRNQLPGYLIPKLVREQSGELSKMPINN